ncbi:hypothetical protein BDW75DRAFT_251750 [Aspergillus navahoensis]
MDLLCLLLFLTHSLAYPRIPVVFDVSASQTLSYAEAPISGFWITAFLTATDGSQYFFASGLLASKVVSANVPNVSFDLVLHATSPAAYYYGTGVYRYVNDTMCNWIELDPSASLTWYDRVWGRAELREGNSTFFVLYFDNSNLVLWATIIQSIDPPLASRSANHRARGECWQHIHAVDVFKPNMDAVWTSRRTGKTYPQEWRLGIEGCGELRIRSVVGDHELAATGGGTGIFMGVSTFEGVLDGEDVAGLRVSGLRLAGIV